MNKIEELLKDIPHGHGLSFKKGISDLLLESENHQNKLPNGHNKSYQRGKQFGKHLKIMILKNIKQ